MFIEDSWTLLTDPQEEHVVGSLAGDLGLELLWEDIREMKGDDHKCLRQKRELFSWGLPRHSRSELERT